MPPPETPLFSRSLDAFRESVEPEMYIPPALPAVFPERVQRVMTIGELIA